MEGTSARGDSGPSGSPENVLRTTDKVQSSFLANLAKHGKYVVVGGTGCWWVGMQEAISDVWYGESGWIRYEHIARASEHRPDLTPKEHYDCGSHKSHVHNSESLKETIIR